jgi:NitT/TauT family transport system substrate-binding protein
MTLLTGGLRRFSLVRGTACRAPLVVSFILAGMLVSGPLLAKDQVTLRLDWTLEGFHLPFVWALAKNYYADEGIEAKIYEGRGSGNVAQLVGAKADTFGEADSSRAALARGQGAPLKVLASFIQRSEGTVISYATSGIKKPEDLIGKNVGSSEGSSSNMLFRAMLKAAAIPEGSVKFISVDSTAKVASLLQHRVDAITGLLSAECVHMREQSPGETINCMPVADFGVKALGVGLLAHEDTIKENPDLVRRFVRASVKGWTEAVKNPAEAAEIGKQSFPLANTKLLEVKLKAVAQALHSPASMGHPVGWMAQEDWLATIDMLKSFMGLTSAAPVTDYYTNDFIPESK